MLHENTALLAENFCFPYLLVDENKYGYFRLSEAN